MSTAHQRTRLCHYIHTPPTHRWHSVSGGGRGRYRTADRWCVKAAAKHPHGLVGLPGGLYVQVMSPRCVAASTASRLVVARLGTLWAHRGVASRRASKIDLSSSRSRHAPVNCAGCDFYRPGYVVRSRRARKSVTRPDRAPPRRRGHNEVMPANRIPYERYFEVSAMPARACLCIRTPTCGA